MAKLFSRPDVRDWFYHQARIATGDEFKRFERPGQKVMVIGDAAQAGKSRPVISSGFEAALQPRS